jgi:hypothetical protein
MPSPNDAARKQSSKKAPETKVADLTANRLARRKSQDFAAKIAGWNQLGGGIVEKSEKQKQNEVVVTHDSSSEVEKSKPKEHVVAAPVEADPVPRTDQDMLEVKPAVKSRPTTPKTPRILPYLPLASTTVTTDEKKHTRAIDLERRAWVRRKSRAQVDVPSEVKEAIAPKKRVVSDGHWRKDRVPVKKEEPAALDKEVEKEAEPALKPIYIRRSHVNVGLKVPVSHQDFSETDPETEPTRTRPLRSRSPRERTPDYESKGTKVYIQRRAKSRHVDDWLNARISESSFTAPSSNEKSGATTTELTTPRSSPPLRPQSAPREHVRKPRSGDEQPRPKSARPVELEDPLARDGVARPRSKTMADASRPDRLPRQPSTSAQAYAKRITQRAEKEKEKEKPPPKPVPRVFGNRIEGWLNNMPDDPFDDSKSALTPEPLDINKKRKSKQNPPPETEESDAPESGRSSAKKPSPREEHKKQQAGDPVEQSKQREQSKPEEQRQDEVVVEVEATTLVSPATTLRRRGARHQNGSLIKNKLPKDPTSEPPHVDDAVMSGAIQGLPRERRRAPSARKNDRFRIPSDQRPRPATSDETLRTREHGHGRAWSDDMTTITRSSDGDTVSRRQPSLKRRPTKHEDLMSVLSMPRSQRSAIMPARSVRRSLRKVEPTTIPEVMNELSTDELKYQRELRTLVEGVIPVLLKHAIADAESPSRSRVLSGSTNDPSVTRPIVNMGVALEKLKTSHKRIPLHEPGELLTWAEGASKLYTDYLQVWRLGFKDIVVNLAPADQKAAAPAWDHGMPRNKDGDLVDGTGERVDVAYLLKRPLVRLKHLAKTFKSINQVQPSANAEDMSASYQTLVADAKQRVNDEQARLEDEAASRIDATRARDPRSLAPITGITIDQTRSVRARDYFDMELMHSSGQQLGCKIEIIYRDDAPGRGKSGDVLFCEISVSGRWLLFPPIPRTLVSARQGDTPSELIVMIRGFLTDARQWRETMSLRAEDEGTCLEWLQMLGSSPMPPKTINRRSSFNMLKDAKVSDENVETSNAKPDGARDKSRDPSPHEIEVPIGERAKSTSRIWDGSEVNSACGDYSGAEASRQPVKSRRGDGVDMPLQSSPGLVHPNSQGHAHSPRRPLHQARNDISAASAAHTAHRSTSDRPHSRHARSHSDWTGSTVSTTRTGDYRVWMPSSEDPSRLSDESSGEDERRQTKSRKRTSSVPPMAMPSVPKIRQPSGSGDFAADGDHLSPQKRTPQKPRADDPSSAPAQLQQRLSVSKQRDDKKGAPPAPAHREKPRPISLGLNLSNKLPSLTPAFMRKTRRPSSPLKHEYEPSSDSDSLSDSETSDDYDDSESDTSHSTVDDVAAARPPALDDTVSTVGDLKGFNDYSRRGPRQSPPPSVDPSHRLSIPSLTPSESASQQPYRTVPPTAVEPAKTVASMFAWAERGSWDSLHPEECQIFVTPGLIEAFDIAQANSVVLSGNEGLTPSAKGIKPLVALELTPLVPLRRGTAVDITVRSPPSANSLYRTGANVMFRSRSPEDCEKLYTLINRARIDNPTYIALQKARGPVQESNWGDIMERNAQVNKRRSWWNINRRGSTYRSTGTRPQSTAATESSVGTMNSAFSALRRFSGTSNFFNIAKSTIMSREGTGSTANSDSLGSGGSSTPLPASYHPDMGTPVGISNAKIRLYVRESASKWRDMGSARLTVMIPPRSDPTLPANPKTTGLQKRIFIVGKSKGETLVDVTLGESAFERIARTGIAMSVYRETERVGDTGGVMAATTSIYMLQMKSVSDRPPPRNHVLRILLTLCDDRNATRRIHSAWLANCDTDGALLISLVETQTTSPLYRRNSLVYTSLSLSRFFCLDCEIWFSKASRDLIFFLLSFFLSFFLRVDGAFSTADVGAVSPIISRGGILRTRDTAHI